MTTENDTFKYVFKVQNTIVHCGITNDLSRREKEHQNSKRYTLKNKKRYYWKNGKISQVGYKTSRISAMKWEKENNCNENWIEEK